MLTAFTQLQFAEHLYRELQLGRAPPLGTRSPDELLENKSVIDGSRDRPCAHQAVGLLACSWTAWASRTRCPAMKALLAQVVEAEKAAEANVIRRRRNGGHACSLLNTAKVMEGSPLALRMKELETLERGRAHRQDLRGRRSGPGAQWAGEAALSMWRAEGELLHVPQN